MYLFKFAKSAVWRRWFLIVLGAAVVVAPSIAAAQNRRAAARRTATIRWEGVSLMDAAAGIQLTYNAIVFIDRRLDPSKPVSLNSRDADINAVLDKFAEMNQFGVTRIGSLHYLGPSRVVELLRTLAALRNEEADGLPSQKRATLLQKKPLDWPRLTEPRNLVADVVQQRGWRVMGIEKIPHDVWRTGKLPEMTMPEQLTTILAGFDLTYRFGDEASAIEIVPIEGPVTLTRRYRLRYGAADADRLAQQFPALQTKVEGEWVSIAGRLEDHAQLEDWFAGPQSRPSLRQPIGPTKQVFTLRVKERTVDAVVDTLVQQLNWQLEIDHEAIRAAGITLDRRVNFQVANATQDELLSAFLHPVELDYVREGDRLKIVPRRR